MDSVEFRKDFPILNRKMNGQPLVYLDNGATTQKPEHVVRALCGYYGGCNANPHRGAYELSVKATEIYRESYGNIRTGPGAGTAVHTCRQAGGNHFHQKCH